MKILSDLGDQSLLISTCSLPFPADTESVLEWSPSVMAVAAAQLAGEAGDPHKKGKTRKGPTAKPSYV